MKWLICFLLAVATSFIFQSTATACTLDTDCSPGNKCVRQGESFDEVCVGGISPGNSNDKKPGKFRFDKTYGDTCFGDADCSGGYRCVKGSGFYGTCMKKKEPAKKD